MISKDVIKADDHIHAPVGNNQFLEEPSPAAGYQMSRYSKMVGTPLYSSIMKRVIF